MKFFSLLSLGFFSAASAQRLITHCKPGYVALTFDDGPFKFTKDLVHLLDSEGVKATFFVCGENFWSIGSEESKDALRTAYNSGHQIASHTWSHKDMNAISHGELMSEITKLEDAVANTIGQRPAFLRPPYGNYNDEVLDTLESNGYTTVIWSTDTKDYETHDIKQERQNIRSSYDRTKVDKGYIVLSHDVYDQTATELAKELIQYTKAEGFKFATVAECVGKSPYK